MPTLGLLFRVIGAAALAVDALSFYVFAMAVVKDPIKATVLAAVFFAFGLFLWLRLAVHRKAVSIKNGLKRPLVTKAHRVEVRRYTVAFELLLFSTLAYFSFTVFRPQLLKAHGGYPDDLELFAFLFSAAPSTSQLGFLGTLLFLRLLTWMAEALANADRR